VFSAYLPARMDPITLAHHASHSVPSLLDPRTAGRLLLRRTLVSESGTRFIPIGPVAITHILGHFLSQFSGITRLPPVAPDAYIYIR